MAMWLYQMAQDKWPPKRYRLEIWENERWKWPCNKIHGDERPEPGDQVVFFYAPSGCKEPGFYGWAVVLQYEGNEENDFYFRPVAPSDQLKMHPWWEGNDDTNEAKRIADLIRGDFPRKTMWLIPDKLAATIGTRINAWIAGNVSAG